MLPAARYELLLVNDSDVRVPSDYLRKVIAPFADASVGLVTCLYRGCAAPTLGSRLEALGIGTDFVPGVLSAILSRETLRLELRAQSRCQCLALPGVSRGWGQRIHDKDRSQVRQKHQRTARSPCANNPTGHERRCHSRGEVRSVRREASVPGC